MFSSLFSACLPLQNASSMGAGALSSMFTEAFPAAGTVPSTKQALNKTSTGYLDV